MDQTVRRQAVIDFLERAGLDVTYKRFTTDNIMIRCPFAKVGGHSREIDSNPSLGLKISDKGFLYNCFTCHRKGRSLVQFIEELQKFEIINSSVNPYVLQNSMLIKFPEFGKTFVLNPIDKNKIDLPDIKFRNELFWNYNVNTRGINKLIVNRLDLRFDRVTKQIVFPCYDVNKTLQGKVVHYTDKRLPKYSNKMFDRGSYLYLEWLAKINTIGIIVEGMYDAIKTYQYLKEAEMLNDYSVVATFGNEVAVPQLRKIVSLFRALILYGDNDIAGIAMEREVYTALKNKLPVISRLIYQGKDPDKVSFKQFTKIIKKPVLFGAYA